MMEALFYVVILLANTIQGVTGFAGTILAMPFSIQLVGIEVSVPVLNMLGILAGIYVFVLNVKAVQWREILRVVVVMGIAIVGGVFLKGYMLSYDKVLYILLGLIVLFVALQGLVKTCIIEPRREKMAKLQSIEEGKTHQDGSAKGVMDNILMMGILILAGLVHGMFICGGPLLISYLTKRISDKKQFRATISTIWIFLNSLLLGLHIYQGMWTAPVIKSGLISIPFLFGGMALGSLLFKHMSQRVFLIITYVLLVIAAITLFIK